MTQAGLFSVQNLILALVLLGLWVFVLVWLSQRALRLIARGTGWKAGNWRSILLAFICLLAAIHFGNWLVTLLHTQFDGSAVQWPGFPRAFLIGSVALGVGIAAVRTRRRSPD